MLAKAEGRVRFPYPALNHSAGASPESEVDIKQPRLYDAKVERDSADSLACLGIAAAC